MLPQWAYTAAAWGERGPVVWAIHTDRRKHWTPDRFSTPEVKQLVKEHLARFPGNQVLTQLNAQRVANGCNTPLVYNELLWNASQRFAVLQSGEVDVLSRNTTWTLTRDASLGLHFTGVTYYDGQGFMVTKKSKITSAKQLKGATVCVQSGTTTEKNLTDFSKAANLNMKPVVFDTQEATNKAYFAGRCQAYTTDASGLASVRNKEANNPDDHVILPDLISKEPLGPSVRRGDDEFFTIAKWVVFALIEAEEYGITQANVDQLAKDSKDPVVQRILGTSEDMGKLLGLDKDWAARAIKAVGNYGEIFERNVGPKSALKLPRGANNLWNKGGLMYAPPVR